MTKEELSKLCCLRRETEEQLHRLEELEKAAATVSAIAGAPNTKRSRLEAYAAEMAELQASIDVNLKKCFDELNRLTRYINSIDDSLLRLILSFRYINGLHWKQIAAKLGRRATEDSVRMRHNRFLSNTPN